MRQLAIALSIFIVVLILASIAHARDPDGRYAGSPLKSWFDSLTSGKGPCCSDADGNVVLDADWKSADGHYSVRLQGVWVEVPDSAVLKIPNRDGRTIVWPMFTNGAVAIRCFIVGWAS